MSLTDTIKADLDLARRAGTKDSIQIELLRTLVGTIDTRAKQNNPARALTDDEVVAVVRSLLKGVVETVAALTARGDRLDDIAKAERERAILEGYLPQQMTEADLVAFAEAQKAQGANMGGIMAALKAERTGQYDGKLASTVVKRVLA